jgi:putative membrane protein
MTVHDLPAVNASLNGVSALLLGAGWLAIRRGRRDQHKRLMLTAVATSAAFLACYLYYHFQVRLVTRYPGEGLDRTVYLFILITHIALAPLIVPFVAAAVWQAVRGRFDRHVRITRWLWPAWMYVSVTGVAIYVMLYVL